MKNYDTVLFHQKIIECDPVHFMFRVTLTNSIARYFKRADKAVSVTTDGSFLNTTIK